MKADRENVELGWLEWKRRLREERQYRRRIEAEQAKFREVEIAAREFILALDRDLERGPAFLSYVHPDWASIGRLRAALGIPPRKQRRAKKSSP